MEHSALAAQARLVHVVGTTGLERDHLERLAAAARHATIVRAGNMSVGVNLLATLVRQVAATLGPDYDIEIVEMHHRHKVDAPSGTALMFGEAAAAGRRVSLPDVAERGRDGVTGPRAEGAIGFACLRGGDVVGEHDVIFAGPGERVVLRHVATDRMLYARGALRAAHWGQDREPGLYDMLDVLGIGPAAWRDPPASA
jgi:4-hydroxy-tetrahydrodipicolinate reductase